LPPGEPERRRTVPELSDPVWGEIAQAMDRRAVRPEISRQRKATRLKVLAGFAAALAVLAVISVRSYRAARTFADDAAAAVHAPEAAARAAAEAQRLSSLIVFGGVARTAIVLLVLFLLLRDIAAREKAEDRLRRAHDEAVSGAEGRRVAQAEAEKLGERLSAVLDHIDIGVLMVELDGSMSIYNLAAERIHGAWREQMERLKLAGTHPAMFEDEKTVIPAGETPLGRALKGQTVRDAHIYFRTPFRPNGYHLAISAVPLRDHRGMLTGAVLMFTERKK
jgi:PAS domain-containing protein